MIDERISRISDGRLRIVVGGFLGLLPTGGVTWDYVQYPLGLAALGHDVFYLEDTRLWPVYDVHGGAGGCRAGVQYLESVMQAFGFADRWAYLDEASGECYGLPRRRLREMCRSADVFVNISCATYMRDEYLRIPARALVDSDPMFTQIQYAAHVAFTPGESTMRDAVAAHTHHFTFGENIASSDCRIPWCGVAWKPTRQPICLNHWPPRALPVDGSAAFTTVMNWTAGRPLEFENERWGQKDVEFLRVLPLPRAVPAATFAVAVGRTGGTKGTFPRAEIERLGWQVLEPAACVPDWRSYRSFIRRSRGEVSVAKETYVKARTGWFSGRSACYLATGRPVITQETGWSRYVPAGEGLLAFADLAGAVDAVERVCADPTRHARAAREVAAECFDARRVLADLLRQVGA